MNFSLIFVGAHNGRKTLELIKKASETGNVLLIEPVPWLFESLVQTVKDLKNIVCLNIAVSDVSSDSHTFFAPLRDADNVLPFGTELGSLSSQHAYDHAKQHGKVFGKSIQEIKVKTLSFHDLIKNYNIDALDTLVTDMEGADCLLLPTFPFSQIKPRQIVFEFKHADGFLNLGNNFIYCLQTLLSNHYEIRPLNHENLLATHRQL